MARYRQGNIMLNLGLRDNYSFVCPTAQLVLNLSKPVSPIHTLSESVIVGLTHGSLIDLDHVIDIKNKCFKEIPGSTTLTGKTLQQTKADDEMLAEAKAIVAAKRAEEAKTLEDANEIAKAKLVEDAKSKILGKSIETEGPAKVEKTDKADKVEKKDTKTTK